MQWQFNPHEGDKAVSVVGSDDIVFYIDDLNPEVVAKVVEIYNTTPDMSKIDAYLVDEERCTSDEREFIIEQIHNYLKLTGEEPASTDTAPATTDDTLKPEPPKQEGEAPPFDKDDKNPPIVKTPAPASTTTTTTTRTRRTATAKTESTEDLIKSLQEKIDIIKVLDGFETPEIPTGLTKTSRDLLTEFQKEYEGLVAKYLDRVKKM